MPLSSGARLGPYEIIAAIGAGGMGEVYKARDTRLDRIVAIKVLPPQFSADPERRARFEREAKTIAGLSHPHICTLYDVGESEGSTFLVMEHLTGETLAQRLEKGPLPLEQALTLGTEIADALAAAHQQGVIHRDLKPGNVMLTKAGAKLLDFGLAKLKGHGEQPAAAHLASAPTQSTPLTGAGMIVGTLQYMAPEQLEGKPADARTDLWALGAILYEMVTGKRAFEGTSAASLITAIMSVEPAPLSTLQPLTPPGVDRLVRRCLAKSPEDRWGTAHDVAEELRWLRETSGVGALTGVQPRRRRGLAAAAVLAAVVVGAAGSALYFGVWQHAASSPGLSFQRLTFRRGWVSAARFAPDGHTVAYSAEWDGEASEVFSRRLESPEAQPLGHPSAKLLAIAPTSELGLVFQTQGKLLFNAAGTLATVPLAAGTPRQLDSQITFADWSPDGKDLAVVRQAEAGVQLEWPPGKVLYSSSSNIYNPRISPSGDRVAFIETPRDTGSLVVVDRRGQPTVLVDQFRWGYPPGLAWSPKGDEVWFGVSRGFSNSQELWAVTLNGRQRLLYRDLVSTRLLDVAKDGKVLVAADRFSCRHFFRGAGDVTERELSWLDCSMAGGLSRDGHLLFVEEQGDSVGSEDILGVLYLRDTGGKPPLKLGPGHACAFSADERVVASVQESPPDIVLYPIPTGPPERIPVKGITASVVAGLLPPAYQTLVVSGFEPGHAPRIWLVNRDGTQPRPITPEGVTPACPPGIPPDGTFILGVSGGNFGSLAGAKTLAYPVAGGAPRPLTGLRDGEEVAGWGADGHSFFAYHGGLPLKIFRVDDRSGARTLAREITPTDRSGQLLRIWALVTPDGTAYSYTTVRSQSELYLIDRLK